MSEYKQVDLQIGTEEQFETKKANLPEGAIVGLTDPIHENELDSSLQTKLNSGTNVYKHAISIPCTLDGDINNIFILKVNIISSSQAEYTLDSFCAELVSGTDKTLLPCYVLTPISGSSFQTGAMMAYNLEVDTWGDGSYRLRVKALLFEDFDGAMQPERELICSESIDATGDVFSDTVIQL